MIRIALLTLVIGLNLTCRANTIDTPHDYTNRVSTTDRITIASWEDDDEGFYAIDPRVVLKNADKSSGWDFPAYEGKKALKVKYPKGEPANRWRSVKRTFSPGIDLGGRSVIEYGIVSYEGPGRDIITRLALVGPGGKRYEASAHIIPSLWRAITFDVSGCTFLNDIRAIEIALRNESSATWDNPVFFIDGLTAGRPLDLDFNLKGSSAAFKVNGKGTCSNINGQLLYSFKSGSNIELTCDTSRNMMYNPPLERRNTIRLIIENNSSSDSIRLYFSTKSNSGFSSLKSKAAALPAKGEKAVVQINLSDIDGAKGHLDGLRLEPMNGNGTIAIDRITFEREQPITTNAGKIIYAIATKDNVSISGSVNRQWLDSGAVAIEVRHAPLWQSELQPDSLELLDYCAYSTEFTLNGIANSRFGGKMSHLSSRMAAFLRLADGRLIPIGQPFFIENWRDFTSNPYSFDLPSQSFNVKDFGAKGDGFTNDNAAIQTAINAAAQSGGGSVVLPSGGEYIATDLNMRSNVELKIESGAVLRQSSRLDDYISYRPEYGHDNIIPGIPWTHCMYTNMPFILAKDVENVKITGGGTIRMEDTFTENPTWTHYARHCSDRIHIVPIAVCNTRHVEISDIDINRANNYHTIFYRADSVMIGNLKMLEVACLSGDGISLGNAVTNVKIDRCVFESNDDGIVIAASYKDPRGGGWRVRVDSIDATIRNIQVLRSYIDSNRGGEGKAIAFIPWASTNPRLDHNEISDLEIHDCVLRGGHSIGTWPDNPFDGKVFINAETDDYSPIKNVNITGNEYLSKCDMMWVEPTSFITDCGLHSATSLKNGSFDDRTAYWTTYGDMTAESGEIKLSTGSSLRQGLWLTPGDYTVDCDYDGGMIEISPDTTFHVDEASHHDIAVKALSPATIKKINLTKQTK